MNWSGYLNIFLEGLRKTTKTLSQRNRYQGPILKPGLPGNEVGILTTPSRHYIDGY
jgi:hypothetical protein